LNFFRSIARLVDETSNYASKFIAILCLLLLTFVTVNALMRYLFSKPLWGAEEINGFLLGAIILIGLGPVLKEKGHIRVEILSVLLPAKIKHILELLNSIFTIVWSTIMVIGVVSYGQYILAISKRTQTLEIPVASVYWYVIVGTALFLIQALVEAVKTFTEKPVESRKLKTPL